MQFETLIEISREATLEASKALSKFVNVPVSLGTVRAEMKKDVDFALNAAPSDQVFAISGSIVGDATGIATLGLPFKTACGLCDLLFQRELGTTNAITAEEEDALIELGNIVVGNYLRAFARAMPGKTLIHKTAGMLCDACSNLTKNLVAACGGYKSHNSLFFEVMFNFRHAALAGSVVVVLDATCIQELLECAAAI